MDVCQYTKKEIIRITKVAVELASLRGKKITSVDKANVMATSQLWRSVTSEFIESEYEDIELEHILVDAATMHLLSRPSDFDVILDDMIEIVGDKIKLSGNYAYDPVDETIKTTTGDPSDGIWTKGNNLNEIQFVSYETAEDLTAGTNFTFLASTDVSTLFTNCLLYTSDAADE